GHEPGGSQLLARQGGSPGGSSCPEDALGRGNSTLTLRPLIEQWFPAAMVGAESLRERGSAKAFPPINFLHVWWARRPLIASRAAVVASLLPAWPDDDEVAAAPNAAAARKVLESEFPGGEDEYRRWFVRALGILGDPLAGRARIAAAEI